jgi:hypothetical protein
MVFLVSSKNGLSEVLALLLGKPAILWLACDLVSKSELAALRAKGNNVTVFAYPESTGFKELEGSVATIEEHHPGHTVWVECASNPSLQRTALTGVR